jgi:hypothetical protein
MKRLILLFAMFGIFATGIAQEWSKEQLALWKSVEDSWNNWKSGEIDKTLATFHSKYKGWSNDQPVPVNKARIEKWWNMMKDISVKYIDLIPVSISIVGNTAVVHYYYEFYAVWGEAKEGKTRKGKNAEFYIKENGKWMLLGDFTFNEDMK